MNKRKQLRILIARIDRIGDVVLSTPLPREIKKAYSDSFVAVLVKKYTKDIYLNNPHIDEIIIFNEDKNGKINFWQLVKTLRRLKLTYAFMLLPNERLNWILFFSGIRTRIGVGHKLYQFLTFSKFVDRKKYIPLRHEADYCLDMVRKIGIGPKSIIPEIHLSHEEILKSDEIKKKLTPNGEILVGINITSGKSSPNLNLHEYKNLIQLLANENNYKVLITDNEPPNSAKNINNASYPNIGLSLRDSIINFNALNVLVSASTGPMHICAALKVPTISMFCPLTACSPKLWGPLGNESEVILPEENYCSKKCPGDPHICDFGGEGGIDSEIVYRKVKSFMANTLNK
ncbi:MAG: glycosyltransferase family 9 protein [Ignavibacteria bacterium]|nr:glycosyltransferase family 9 protein [Ignavibacteria bacterium]MBT8383536.1 glycosyltransferase family 9 protein [Ignavibacteria bacterium]MBT8390497.1 glycosyltransferase family 9 protein [Ignavibacteria bacterium]NNL20038.1 glycosyltransferase family 9 protein [Ignavibacteriaceae bacterium]